jgi:hypothetical protein
MVPHRAGAAATRWKEFAGSCESGTSGVLKAEAATTATALAAGRDRAAAANEILLRETRWKIVANPVCTG